YYCNLAYWLAPRKLRQAITLGLLFRAATHPLVLEEIRSSTELLGVIARDLIAFEVGDANLFRILAPSDLEIGPRAVDDLLASFFLDESTTSVLRLAGFQNSLGTVIREYHRFFAQQGLSNFAWFDHDPTPREVVEQGLKNALAGRIDFDSLVPAFRQEAKDFFAGPA